MQKGKTILSCGHEDVDGCMGVPVQFADEDCVAGEGFIPVTVYAQYCHDCAKTLHFGLGKDAGRAEVVGEIVAWLREQGIANTGSETDKGWWETFTGADYGEEILNQIEANFGGRD